LISSQSGRIRRGDDQVAMAGNLDGAHLIRAIRAGGFAEKVSQGAIERLNLNINRRSFIRRPSGRML